jgi:hypothetical protein
MLAGLGPYLQQGNFCEQVNTTPNVRIAGFQRTGGIGSKQSTSTHHLLAARAWPELWHPGHAGAGLVPPVVIC